MVINVQYYDESESKAVVKTLTCADSEKKHSSQQMCEIFEAALQKFDVPIENVLWLVVDNASNMTKTVEWLNENDVPFKDPDEMHNSAVDEEVDSDNELVMLVNIHHMRCAVHTLQLAIRDGLKQPQCKKLHITRHIVAKLRSSNVLAFLENRERKRSVLDRATCWGSTFLMIQRLFELRNSIEELGVLSSDLHISATMWSILPELFGVLEMPYSVTVKIQAESLTSDGFMKEWCSLKCTLSKKERRLAQEILKSMKKCELTLFQNKLFLARVYVDARYCILLTHEQT